MPQAKPAQYLLNLPEPYRDNLLEVFLVVTHPMGQRLDGLQRWGDKVSDLPFNTDRAAPHLFYPWPSSFHKHSPQLVITSVRQGAQYPMDQVV